MLNTIVTTDRKNHSQSARMAKEAAKELDIPFVERNREGIAQLKDNYKVDNILVAKKGSYVLDTLAGELFFHPNMAQLRIKNIRLGEEDYMVKAMDLRAGMSVLDCTLGFGADAIVASFVTGDVGSVIGMEASPLIAFVTKEGMKSFLASNFELHSAIKRVRVINGDYNDYLKQQPDNSVDVVYFDPMFRHPLLDSHNINPLRTVADQRPVEPAAIEEACRVAKHRVVMKENSRSREFSRLGFKEIVGGKYSKVHYGIIMNA